VINSNKTRVLFATLTDSTSKLDTTSKKQGRQTKNSKKHSSYIVCVEFSSKMPSIKRDRIQLFPTPASPMMMVFNNQSYVSFMCFSQTVRATHANPFLLLFLNTPQHTRHKHKKDTPSDVGFGINRDCVRKDSCHNTFDCICDNDTGFVSGPPDLDHKYIYLMPFNHIYWNHMHRHL
jgi:hypothetical protein